VTNAFRGKNLSKEPLPVPLVHSSESKSASTGICGLTHHTWTDRTEIQARVELKNLQQLQKLEMIGDTNPMSGVNAPHAPVAMPPPPPGSSFYDCAKYFVSAVGNNEENWYSECDEASKRKIFAAVEEALEAGGDINEGEGALLYAVEEKPVILVAGSDPARTVGSFNQNLVNFVKYLIDKGADVNRKGAEQWTPEFFKSKLEVYGGVNGNTPLLAAIRHPCPDIVEMLLDAGASTRTKNFMGNTPLMVACGGVGDENLKEGNLEVIHMLLGRLESGNAEDRANLTGALVCLCDSVCGMVSETKSIELVTIMLEKGADVNGYIAGVADRGADMKIRTAISGAARNGHLQLLRFLVKNGADPSTVYPSVSSKLTVSELALITVCMFGCGDPTTRQDGSEIPAIISQLLEYVFCILLACFLSPFSPSHICMTRI
jgi:ankyrin repeat protein